MKKKKHAGSPGLGCLFWAAMVVVLVAVALAVREPVIRNVRKLLGRTEPDTSTDQSAQPASTRPSALPAAQPAAEQPAAQQPAEQQPAAPALAAPSTAKPGSTATASPSPAPASSPRPSRTRTARLWFAKVDTEGAIELAPVDRPLPVGDSPLRDSLAALIAGPTSSERTAGLVSFVPAGTVVRSVAVKGDTAVIDFNEQFRFNALGVEGLRAELRQVVWAATEFPTVARVQVLIEGKRVDYLGPEGAAVGSPLGRDSAFQ